MPIDSLSKSELLRLAFQDDLTSLYNRRYLLNYLTNEVDWSKTDTPPLSLMMIDVDFFKEINDTYGHLTGDTTLKELAKLIKKTVGKKGIAIRYAGDEFSILLPATDKSSASELGEKLRQTVKKASLSTKAGKPISVSISGGVAAFPKDAHSAEDLIDEADKELYHSKHSGRNKVSSGEQDNKDFVAERELKHMRTIPCPIVVGREKDFAALKALLGSVAQGKNIFLLLEGETGLGKTRTLKELDKTEDEQLITSFLRCNETDRPNPYKSILNHIKQLFEKKIISPKSTINKLSENHKRVLQKVLPDLFGPVKSPAKADAQADTSAGRKLLFESLTELLVVISKEKGLWLFFDEFQNIDDGSLEIFTCLLESNRGQVGFGGALRTTHVEKLKNVHPKLKNFIAEISKTPGYKITSLTKLDQFGCSRIVSAILPHREVSLDFDEKVYDATQGNPLFIEELLKHFILRKYFNKGKEWEFREVMKKEWPKDLDALIQQNLALLDKQTAQLVNESAVVGTELDLSVVKDVSVRNEGETLEMLDKAKQARVIEEIDPLLKPDQFTFVNQRIQEITYDTIDDDTRKDLHGKVGEVKEKLHAANTDQAASALAFHFAKAGNKAKAGTYQKRVMELAQSLFRAEEANSYYQRAKKDVRSKIKEATTPLDDESMKAMREILRAFCGAVKNLKLYPEGSQLITQSFSALVRSFNNIIDQVNTFTLSENKGTLQINTVPVDTKSHGAAVDELITLLKDHYIKNVTFAQGLDEVELEHFLRDLNFSSEKDYAQPGYWNKFLEEQNITHIGVSQRTFVAKGGSPQQATAATKIGLTPETVPLVRNFLRYFCASVENIKLYPLESKITRQAVESLNSSLQQLFDFAKIINIGIAEDDLLLNSAHLHPRDFGTAATTLVNLIKKYKLKSMTLLQEIEFEELGRLVRLLGELEPDEEVPSQAWLDRLADADISNALIGQMAYSLDDLKRIAKGKKAPGETEAPTDQPAPASKTAGDIKQIANELLKGPPDKVLVNELVQLIERLVKAKETSLLGQLQTKFLENFKAERAGHRQRASRIYGQLLTKIPDLQSQLALTASPVLQTITRSEKDNAVWSSLITALSEHIKVLLQQKNLIEFQKVCAAFQARTDLASDIILKYNKLMGELAQDESFKTLLEELPSADETKIRAQAGLLACLGPVIVPELSESIGSATSEKKRTALASIIKKMGAEAASKFMDVFDKTTEPAQRQNLISVLDIITPPDPESLFSELIRSSDTPTRTAAFETLKRFDKTIALNILVPALKDKKSYVVNSALAALGGLGYPEASPDIVELLKSTTDQKLQTTCCETLGKLGDESTVPVLIELITTKKKFLGFGGYPDEVRGQATRALGHFKTAEAKKVLEKALKDASPLVRAAARLGLKG